MCLVTVAINQHDNYPFIFVGNRDEEYQREAVGIHFWPEHPNLLAGRDLRGKGTWLGLTREGKVATLLNHPFTNLSPKGEKITRGRLVYDYVVGQQDPSTYGDILELNRKNYDPYHFVFGTIDEMYVYSNGWNQLHKLSNDKVHSVSNTDDDLSAYRISKSSRLVEEYIKGNDTLGIDNLVDIFQDSEKSSQMDDFPGDLTKGEAINNSSIFLQGDEFGTVATTVILIDRDGLVTEKEIRYSPTNIIEETEKRFNLNM